ncbi:MAG: DUF2313 domain-containing protein [Oscillospiraceae bacterium]|nr:DUF2313 domain-containing protein [Oscillospiraceae bacterium]
MGYADYLKRTLKPLGIYELDEGIGAAELEVLGEALDSVESSLSAVQRNMLPMTAEEEGLRLLESLFTGATGTGSLEARRRALAVMLRLGETECSEQGLNILLEQCGIPADVSETEVEAQVRVTFYDTAGDTSELQRMKRRIEALLPCHLEIVYGD